MSSVSASKTRRLPTIREIAISNGLKPHNVKYVVDRYNIKPAAIAGNVRVFDKNGVSIILGHREEIQSVHKNNQMVRNKRLWDRIILNWLSR